MIIQLVSYKSKLRANSRLMHTANIINSSKADLMLFSGHTLASHLDVFELNSLIENKSTTAILEIKENAISELNPVRHSLYMLSNGVVRDMYTHQLFTDSSAINAYPELADHLLLELETRRCFDVANRNVIVLQCGENGILRNKQSEGNKAIFRFENDIELSHRFSTILDNTHIVLNPIHSPMGNQGKMKKRREYYSNNNRAYFSTANFSDEESINSKSLQYACINGIEQEPIEVEVGNKNTFIIRTFVI